jgi:hypothetical protein
LLQLKIIFQLTLTILLFLTLSFLRPNYIYNRFFHFPKLTPLSHYSSPFFHSPSIPFLQRFLFFSFFSTCGYSTFMVDSYSSSFKLFPFPLSAFLSFLLFHLPCSFSVFFHPYLTHFQVHSIFALNTLISLFSSFFSINATLSSLHSLHTIYSRFSSFFIFLTFLPSLAHLRFHSFLASNSHFFIFFILFNQRHFDFF